MKDFFVSYNAKDRAWAEWIAWQHFLRKGGADAEKVTIGGGDFYTGDDKEIVNRHPIWTHQAFVEQVGYRITGVMVRNDDSVQAFLARRSNVLFRTRDAVTRKEGVSMQVDVERHCWEASLPV